MSFYQLVADYGMAALQWVGVVLAAALAKLVLVHIRNATVLGIIERAKIEIAAAAKAICQTYTDALKAGRAAASPGGSLLTVAEKAYARDLAVTEFKANFGARGLAALARILGVDSLDRWITTHLEAAVNDLKMTAAAVAAVAAPGKLRLPLPLPAPGVKS